MKTKNRLLASVLCLLLVVFSVVGLTACGEDNECSHKWGEWSITTDATCTEAGIRERWCAKCGEIETSAVEALGHDWNEATCSTPKTCQKCSATAGTALAHSYTHETVKPEALKSEATCTSPAVYYKSCSCGAVSTSDADTFTSGSPKHTYDQEVVKPEALKSEATCTSPAVYYKSCSCGAVGTDDAETFTNGSPLAHTYDQEVVKPETLKSEATCTSPAVYYKSCSCGAVSTSDAETFTYGSTLNHTYNQEVVKPEALKSEATCTSPAVYYKSCSCGAVSASDADTFTSGSASSHSYAVASSTDATCEAPATKTYRCACGDTYTENIGDALGHNINGATPTERHIDGCEYVLVYVCQRDGCGKEVEGDHVFHHTYIASITKAATCLEDGEKTLTCSCGDTKTEAIPKDETGHNWVKGTVTDGVRTDTCSHCHETKSVTVYEGTSTDSTNANDLKDTEIELNDANISLDSGVIDTIGDKNITVSADKLEGDDRAGLGLSEEELARIGNSPVYNFTINDGTNNISQFGENNWVTITLLYELADGEDVDSIAIWFINDEGELESIKATYNNGYVTFKTNHFSYYTVTRLTPAERCDLYGHSYVVHHEDGSCTKDAYDLYVCVRCHESKKVIIDEANGHEYVSETHPATCTEDGYVLNTCEDCCHSYTTKINATGHAWSVEESAEATCTANGYAKYGCDHCGEEYTVVYEKVAHAYTHTIVSATCETDGYTLHKCENCEYSYTDAYVAATGHAYRSATWVWANDYRSATLTLVCDNDEKHVLVQNANVGMTVVNGTCSNFVKTIYTAAVSNNGTVYTDEKIIEEGTPDHSFSSDWKKDEHAHWHECVCGQKSDISEHTFENEVVTKNPTCGENGESVSYCVCGAVKVTVIPATGEHIYQDGVCTECGAGFVDAYYVNLINSWKNIDGFAIKIQNFSYEIKQQDSNLLDSLKLIGSIKQIDIAELALYVEDGEIGGAATGSITIFNGPISNANAVYKFKAVIYDEYVYIRVEYGKDVADKSRDIKMSVDSLIESLLEEMDISAETLYVFDFCRDTLIPALDTLVELHSEKTNEILEDAFNMLFTFEQQDDGSYIATLDYDKLYALNENLATKSVAEVIDIYFGEGAFDGVVELVLEILDLEVSEIPTYLDDHGLDSEELIAKFNEFIVKMGAPDDCDIADIIHSEEYAGITLGMLIFEVEDDSYLDDVNECIDYLREHSLYELIDSDSAEKIQEGVASILDMIADSISISFATDRLGMLASISINADHFTYAEGDNEIFLNFNLDMIINGRIEVTWSDIIDSIESSIVFPGEGMLEEYTDSYYCGYGGVSVMYKGEYYYSNGISFYVRKPCYDKLTYMIVYPDCNGWTAFEACYAERVYRFTLATIMVDGNTVLLLIDDYSGKVVELVQTDSGYTAIYEDGTEKAIAFDFPDNDDIFHDNIGGGVIFDGEEVIIVPTVSGSAVISSVVISPIWIFGDNIATAYTEVYFAVFENPEGRLEHFGHYVDYYYNAALQEYANETHHEYEYEYEIHGDSCEDGCTVHITCKNCDYSDEYTRYRCDIEYGVEIDLSESSTCGGTIDVDRCTICGHITDVNNSTIHCDISDAVEEEILDAEGNVVGYKYTGTCLDCGLVFIEREWIEAHSSCEYTEYQGTYIYEGENCIFAYIEDRYHEEHAYEYTYELQGETCEDGVKVTVHCLLCGDTHYYTNSFGHTMIEDRINLEDYGACYGALVDATCACGQEHKISLSGTCAYNLTTNEYYDEEGRLIHDEVHACPNCGLRYTRSYYTVRDRENCTLTNYYTVIVNVGANLVADKQYTVVEVSHDYEVTGTLLNGAGSSCEDGAIITYRCKDCQYEYSQTTHSHTQFEKEHIDLAELGCVCGGYATVSECACGKYGDVSLDHSLCEWGREWCGLWIEDAIIGVQYPNDDYYWYYDDTEAYLYICAVTDPEEAACAYKIRYARYWLKAENKCKIYQYETWQFGYNEETGTCLFEVTYKTGKSRTYHAYINSSIDNQVKYDCPDCGSYYYKNWYYNSEGQCIKYEKIVCNTLNNGRDKYYEYIEEYSYDDDGNRYVSREYSKTINSYNREYWYETLRTEQVYAGSFGESGREVSYFYSNSNGQSYTEQYAYVYYKGWTYDIYRYRIEGEYWYRYDYTYTFEDGCVRTTRYTDSKGVDRTKQESICKFYDYVVIKHPTCTQDGEACRECEVCGKHSKPYTVEAHDHDWYPIDDNWHRCFVCGLMNANGVSGDIVMEDLTDSYGNDENYVVGYWARNNVTFTYYVSLILADETEVVLEGIDFFTIEGLRAVAFNKAAVQDLAVAAGYTDSEAYSVKFSFVPYGSDGSFDYGITFTPKVTVNYMIGEEQYYSARIPSYTKANPPTDPALPGFAFSGWYEAGSEEPFDFTNTLITENVTLYAKFIEIVTVYYMIGEEQYYSARIPSYTKASLLNGPALPGFAFSGWYEAGSEEPFDFIHTLITEDVTLYAKYIEIYTISYNLGEYEGSPDASNPNIAHLSTGEVWPEKSNLSYTVEKEVKIKPASYPNKVCTWVDQDGNVVTTTKGLAKNLELTAIWENAPYISLDFEGAIIHYYDSKSGLPALDGTTQIYNNAMGAASRPNAVIQSYYDTDENGNIVQNFKYTVMEMFKNTHNPMYIRNDGDEHGDYFCIILDHDLADKSQNETFYFDKDGTGLDHPKGQYAGVYYDCANNEHYNVSALCNVTNTDITEKTVRLSFDFYFEEGGLFPISFYMRSVSYGAEFHGKRTNLAALNPNGDICIGLDAVGITGRLSYKDAEGNTITDPQVLGTAKVGEWNHIEFTMTLTESGTNYEVIVSLNGTVLTESALNLYVGDLTWNHASIFMIFGGGTGPQVTDLTKDLTYKFDNIMLVGVEAE